MTVTTLHCSFPQVHTAHFAPGAFTSRKCCSTGTQTSSSPSTKDKRCNAASTSTKIKYIKKYILQPLPQVQPSHHSRAIVTLPQHSLHTLQAPTPAPHRSSLLSRRPHAAPTSPPRRPSAAKMQPLHRLHTAATPPHNCRNAPLTPPSCRPHAAPTPLNAALTPLSHSSNAAPSSPYATVERPHAVITPPSRHCTQHLHRCMQPSRRRRASLTPLHALLTVPTPSPPPASPYTTPQRCRRAALTPLHATLALPSRRCTPFQKAPFINLEMNAMGIGCWGGQFQI